MEKSCAHVCMCNWKADKKIEWNIQIEWNAQTGSHKEHIRVRCWFKRRAESILDSLNSQEIDKDIFLAIPAFISSENTRMLKPEQIVKISRHVSEELKLYPDSMIQYSPEEIAQAIEESRTLVVWDLKNDDLIWFWKYMQWPWVNEEWKIVIEVWTIVVNKKFQRLHYAKPIVKYLTK